MWGPYWIVLSLLSIGICAQNRPIALIGTLLLPDRSIGNGTLLIVDGRIAALGSEVSVPTNTQFLFTVF